MKTVRFAFIVFLLLFISNLLFVPEQCSSQTNNENWNSKRSVIQQIVNSVEVNKATSTKIGLVALDADSGSVLVEHRANESFTPASVLKLVTSYVALKELGGDYRYITEFYLSDNVGPRQGISDLVVKGYGDPSIVSETVWYIAEQLCATGLSSVNDIIIDNSAFIEPRSSLGQRPYQAGLSAVSVNHNSFAVFISPSLVGKKANVSVTRGLEVRIENTVQTVTGNNENIKVEVLNQEKLNHIKLRVSGTIGIRAGLHTRYRTIDNPTNYFSQLLKQALKDNGVIVKGNLRIGKFDDKTTLFYKHYSKSLAEIIRDLNQYSNNFIAEQILYLLGANKDGSYSQEKGIENILLSLKNSGLKTDAIAMQDGSGLSDQNKVTPMLLGEVLKEAYRDFSVEPFMVSSLSRFEQSGTLKERILVDSPQRQISNMKAKKTDFLVKGIWGKTGTLSSVSSLAGYLRDENDKIVIYVIIENGALPKDKAVQIENKIVRTLAGVL